MDTKRLSVVVSALLLFVSGNSVLADDQNSQEEAQVTDVSASHETDSQATDDGRIWSRNSSYTGHGSNREYGADVTANGTVTRNDDGSETYTKDRVTTTQNGKEFSSNHAINVTRDENGNAVFDEARSFSGPNGQRSTVEGSGSVIRNDDGSTTYVRDRVITTQDGKEIATSRAVNVARDEDGNVVFSGQHDVTGPDGRRLSTERSGNATRFGDGSGSWTANQHSTITDADGSVRKVGESKADGKWRRNEDGGRDFASRRDTRFADGQTTSVDREGRTARDANGRGTHRVKRNRVSKDADGKAIERKEERKRKRVKKEEKRER